VKDGSTPDARALRWESSAQVMDTQGREHRAGSKASAASEGRVSRAGSKGSVGSKGTAGKARAGRAGSVQERTETCSEQRGGRDAGCEQKDTTSAWSKRCRRNSMIKPNKTELAWFLASPSYLPDGFVTNLLYPFVFSQHLSMAKHEPAAGACAKGGGWTRRL